MSIDRRPTEAHDVRIPAKEYKIACQVASRLGRAASANAIWIQFIERMMAKWSEQDPQEDDLAKHLQTSRSADAHTVVKLRLPVSICDRLRQAVASLPPEWNFEQTLEAVIQWAMEDMRTTGPLQGRYF